MARRSANGTGTIRKKTVTRNGKKYEYWEARYTEGSDPGTGKQVQRSITGKTQKEVAQKLKAATTAIDNGTYTAPSKQTLGQWLDTWTATYCGGVKPRTLEIYKTDIRYTSNPPWALSVWKPSTPRPSRAFITSWRKRAGKSAGRIKRAKSPSPNPPCPPRVSRTSTASFTRPCSKRF